MKMMWKGELPEEALSVLRAAVESIIADFDELFFTLDSYAVARGGCTIEKVCIIYEDYSIPDYERVVLEYMVEQIIRQFLIDAVPMIGAAYGVETESLNDLALREYAAAGRD